MAWRCRCTLLLESPVRSARLRMLCWPYARIALKMTILLAHNPMVSVRALKGGCNWKNQLFRVRDRPPVVPLYVDAHLMRQISGRCCRSKIYDTSTRPVSGFFYHLLKRGIHLGSLLSAHKIG